MSKNIQGHFCIKNFSRILTIFVFASALPLHAVNHHDDVHPVIKVGILATIGYLAYKTLQLATGKAVKSHTKDYMGNSKTVYQDGSYETRSYIGDYECHYADGSYYKKDYMGNVSQGGPGSHSRGSTGNDASVAVVTGDNNSISVGGWGLGWGWSSLFGSSSIIRNYDNGSDSRSRSRPRPQANSNFHAAAAVGQAEQVESMLNYGQNINAQEANGCTALYCAAEQGKKTVVESLLARRADANITNNNNQSPLFIAAQRGNITCVTALLQPPKTKGFVVWLKDRTFWPYSITINAQNAQGVTPLLTACAAGHIAIVQDLLNANGDYNHIDNKNRNAVKTAAASNHVACVETLLDAKANLEDIQPFAFGLPNNPYSSLRDLYARYGGVIETPNLNRDESKRSET
jgi:ankyrin repeat protein